MPYGIRVPLAVALLLLLAGCAGFPGASGPAPTPSPAAWLIERITTLDGVLSADAAPGDDYLTVHVARDAEDATVLDVAREVAEWAEEAAWPGSVTLVRESTGLDPETDITALSPWSQDVYPGDPAEIEATLTLVLTLEKLPDVASANVSADGWPSVHLTSLETFASTFRTLSALPQFADGATYSYLGELPKLQIVHLSERMSAEAIEAVIRIAVENPESEVELQSLTSEGNRWPELWVAHLTEEQRVRVDAQLRDPALADADPEGYSIPFQLSVLGPTGPELSWGTFGDVPDTSS